MLSRSFVFMLGTTLLVNPVFSETEVPAQHAHSSAQSGMLTAPGNDAFGAIQEVVNKLMSDPGTDWKRVNLEALRQHLVDMANTTLYVDVVEQKPIKNGITFTVKPTTPGATASLDRTMSAHSEILKQETGWALRAKKQNSGWRVDVTSSKLDEVVKIQGLGYIGIMALGNHHQPHHWQMATGSNPHHAH
jgi:hypothetical protein